jgi:hypothetical protein
MRSRVLLLACLGLVGSAAPALALQPTAHQAVYAMSLDHARSSSGVVGANGTLLYKWADVCDGWTVEQRYKLTMRYDQGAPVDIESDFVTWESKDGKSYRFNEKETRNGDVDTDIRGDATLDGPGHSGIARFEKPKPRSFLLPKGTLLPTAHTFELIRQAEAGQRFFTAHVFDGSTFDGASTISAVLVPQGISKADDLAAVGALKSPLLQRPGWTTWLSFFSDAGQDTEADYLLGMRLMDNGVSRSMSLDYGDYVIAATLQHLEALPKPVC